MTINPFMRGPRGTGRTAAQIAEAPKSSVYIWCSHDFSYPMGIANRLGRTDLLFRSDEQLEREPGFLMGAHNWVAVDHAVALSETAWGAVMDARRRYEEWESRAARLTQEKVDAEAPAGPYAHVPYQLMAAVAYIAQPGDMRPEAAALYRPTMRIAWLNMVAAMLDVLKKPPVARTSNSDINVHANKLQPNVEHIEFLAELTRQEIARLRNPAVQQVREQIKEEKEGGWRD